MICSQLNLKSHQKSHYDSLFPNNAPLELEQSYLDKYKAFRDDLLPSVRRGGAWTAPLRPGLVIQLDSSSSDAEDVDMGDDAADVMHEAEEGEEEECIKDEVDEAHDASTPSGQSTPVHAPAGVPPGGSAAVKSEPADESFALPRPPLPPVTLDTMLMDGIYLWLYTGGSRPYTIRRVLVRSRSSSLLKAHDMDCPQQTLKSWKPDRIIGIWRRADFAIAEQVAAAERRFQGIIPAGSS